MKDRADIKPYHHSDDWHINFVITMRKLYKRLLDANTSYKPMSRFQKRSRSARAAYFGKRTIRTVR
ncbi:MAG: hypothetical protein PHF20_09315 [Halothiobacillaceae bacterium]|nr:hypothetical protein [Halothiobacillaceae bacterium]